jgi:hypothetical protein
MITVHNLGKKTTISRPIRSTIIGDDSHLTEKAQKPYEATEGWQAYSGKSTITWPSPTAVSETETESAGHLKDTNMDIVNRARYCDIAISTGADDLSRVVAKTGKQYLLSASAFGNWRHRKINSFANISERVMLQMENQPKTNYSIDYDFTSLGDTILNNKLASTVSRVSDAVNTVALTAGTIAGDQDLVDNAITGERASLYQDFKVANISKTKTSAFLTEAQFKFKFGQAGLFSGEEEVVKPILALVGPWALKTGDYHSVFGPFPTRSQADRKAVLKTMELIGGDESLLKQDREALESDSNTSWAANMVKNFNSFTDKLYGLIDTIAEECFKCTTTVTFIIGGLVVGPFVPKKVSWGFDFDNVDEFGYPCEGWFKFDELEPIRLFVNSDYARQWGYTVGMERSENIVSQAQVGENALNRMETMATVTGSVTQ